MIDRRTDLPSGMPDTPPDTPPQRRPGRTVLWLWLLLLSLGAAVIWRSHFNADLSAFMPAAPNAQQRVLIEQLHSGTPARSLNLAIEGGTAALRGQASAALAGRLRASGLFEQVHNGDRLAWAAVGDYVLAHRYLLSPAVDAQRFTAQGLREAINDTVSLLGTPAGASLKPLLHRDPSGEVQRIAEASLSAPGPRTEHGVWISRDGQRALLLTQSRAAGADLDGQAAAMAQIHQAFTAVRGSELTLKMSGTPKFAADSRAQIEAEVRWLAIAGTLLMGGLLWLSFGSVAALAAALLPVVCGVVAGICAVSLGFGSVHGITLGFGTTLIGEAVDYAIYYLIQARALSPSGSGWRVWLAQGWPTVRLGLLTSVCGFAALAFSGFTGLAQLGVFSIAGLMAAALTTRWVLPVLLPDGAHSPRSLRRRAQLGRWAAALVRQCPKARPAIVVLGLAAAALLMWRHDGLWRAELSSLSPVSREALALDAALRAELSNSDAAAVVVVQANDAQVLLQAVEATTARLDALVDQGRLGGFQSVSRLLPSLATQQRRQASLPSDTALRTALAQATAAGPLPAARLEPFIADMQTARLQALVTPAAVAGTALAGIVDALLVQRPDGRWAALLPLHPVPGGVLDLHIVQRALHDLPSAQVLDIGAELGRLYRHYLREAQAQALAGALGVLLLMALWLRSWRRLLAVSLPLLLSVLLTMAALTLLQVPLGILHLVGLLLVVAVGSNYALFFDLLKHADTDTPPTQGLSDHDTLASLLLANLTTVLSFGLIALSDVAALSAIGRVVAPGALLALLLSAAFAPPPFTRRTG